MTNSNLTRHFKKLPPMETPRLLLRKIMRSDYQDMYEYASLESVTKYVSWSPHPNIQFTKQYLIFLERQYRLGNYYDWAVTLKGSGKMIGTCGFSVFNSTHRSAEIGYVLHPDYWNQGYASEAVRAVLAFGFNELQLHRIEARFMQKNTASLRVMEKAGMQFEGFQREAMYIKGSFETVGTAAILASEFEP